MNKLVLTRLRTSDYGTFGTLELSTSQGDFHLCHTLEPAVCDNDHGHGVLCGEYPLSITYSPKFSRPLPLLSVPGREGIRIHVGNNAYDTQGCILVGLVYTKTTILFSKLALKHVLEIIRELKISTLQIRVL